MIKPGCKAKNHPQQRTKDAIDDRGTPPEVFDPLHERFKFTIDVAAAKHNAKLPRYYAIEDDGLNQSWAGERVWCNPPFSNIRPWVEKAWDERICHGTAPIVMLLPANRTEQAWWQDLIEPERDRPSRLNILSVEFLRGRTRFITTGNSAVLPNQRPPFGCCLCIWRGT